VQTERLRAPGSFACERLPRGRHRLPAAAIAENQRWRLLAAVADVFHSHGYMGTTSKRIASSARVSSSTFYRYFADVSDCLRAGFEVAADSLLRLLADRRKVGESQGLRSLAEALLAFRRAEPQLANLLGLELAVAERGIGERRRELIARIVFLFREVGAGGGPLHEPALGEQLGAATVALCLGAAADRSPFQDLPGQVAEVLTRSGAGV
jgi:AcrR family transcriptional regulator